MTFKNRLTRILNIEHPILLAPMDLVSGGRVAAAVSQAGGLGLLGGGYGDADWIDREWDRTGNARIGCGFITWSLAKNPQILDRTLAHGPAAIMLSFGDPRPFAAAIHAAGALLICQVQTVAQACEAQEAGADIIVAQGTEAGGHGMSEPRRAHLTSTSADSARPRRRGDRITTFLPQRRMSAIGTKRTFHD
jgi:nitronate monooxygenase